MSLAKGICGLAKAALGIDRASPETVAARRDACRGCDQASKNPDPQFAANGGLTTWSKCQRCGCYIGAKTLIQSETCPDGKW